MRRAGPGLLLLLGLAAGTLAAQRPRLPSLDSLERRARVDSNDAIAHYELALGYMEKKRWDQADTALRVAVTIAPGYADAYLALSVLPDRRGEKYWKRRAEKDGREAVAAAMAEGELYYRRAFRLNPLVDLGVLARFEELPPLMVVPTPTGYFLVVPPWWQRELVKAMNEFRDARYQKAMERLSELMANKAFGGSDENVPDPILWYHGLAAAHQQEFDIAIRDFALLTGRAYAAESDSTVRFLPLKTNDYRFVLATMLYLAGRPEQAIPVFRRTLEFDLGLYPAHVQLARMHEAQGRLEEALAERQLAVAVNSEEADPELDLAMTLLRLGRAEPAMRALERAEALNRRDPRIPYLRGSLLLHLGQREEARAALTRFLAIAPSRMGDQVAEARRALAGLE